MPTAFWNAKSIVPVAHRGGDAAGKDRENTVEAFRAAQKLNYKYAETDIVRAASGELVVVHGTYNWLQAGITRGVPSSVLQKMTLAQMQTIIRPGGQFQVHTLEELLERFPRLKFVIDVKTDEVIRPLIKLLKRLDALERVCISDNDYQRCQKLTKACGRDKDKLTVGLTVGRGLRFRNMNQFLLKGGHLKGVEAIFMHHSLVSPPMVGLVHRRGFKAVVWTANSRIAINNAIRSGADAIISDRVGLLKQILEAKK
jgi:glycerophosphoryl diester phosphodiesterase